MRRCFLLLVAAVSAPLAAQQGPASGPTQLTVDVGQPGHAISPRLYGLMTEEINHSYDGGLYAEEIRNRTFEDTTDKPVAWSVVASPGASGAITIDSTKPVNDSGLKRSLRLDMASVSEGQRVGVANEGFWGFPIQANIPYTASFYARASSVFSGPLTVDLETTDGEKVYASAQVSDIGTEWKKYSVTLTPEQSSASVENRFVISGAKPGTVWLSMVSLFPPTFNNRPNGSRIDLMQRLAAMHPSFLRFPGGNYLEGPTIPDRFAWKQTIGPVETRPGHMSPWGYRSSDGFGLLEFLDWCEDLHMEPLLAVYDGLSFGDPIVRPGKDLEPYVQEALDEIEYVTGDSTTTWGKRRAEDGHPAPFTLHYVEVGNEDGGNSYDARFAQFFDAIKAKYPDLQIIATSNLRSRVPDVIDEHFYMPAEGSEREATHYDDYVRGGPKIFVGEWATTEGSPTPTLKAALADAAFLTGLERNSDIVVMASYAPLLVNVSNRAAWQWGTNLIGYNALSTFGSPSYYMQVMFSEHRGDVVLPVKLDIPGYPPPAPKVRRPMFFGGNQEALPPVFATASRDNASGDVILKVVNTGPTPQHVQLTLSGVQQVDAHADAEVLAGMPDDVNSIEEPEKVAPKHVDITDAGTNFTHDFPAFSVTVIVFKAK